MHRNTEIITCSQQWWIHTFSSKNGRKILGPKSLLHKQYWVSTNKSDYWYWILALGIQSTILKWTNKASHTNHQGTKGKMPRWLCHVIDMNAFATSMKTNKQQALVVTFCIECTHTLYPRIYLLNDYTCLTYSIHYVAERYAMKHLWCFHEMLNQIYHES